MVPGRELELSNNKIAVFTSGKGSNLQALIDAVQAGYINANIRVVVSNRKESFALERAKKHKIEALYVTPVDCRDSKEYFTKLIKFMEKREIDLICLAGFLLMIQPELVRKYKGRILNIHPALLPGFGGKGMYGHHVHEAVIKSGAKYSGCTVHFVDEEYDHGQIVLQRVVPVHDDDTPDTLAERVLKEEHKAYPDAVKLFVEGKLEIKDRKVIIKT